MIAQYGYSDASGDYFIAINVDYCGKCEKKPCMDACPEKVFYSFEDEYGENVIAVKDSAKNRLWYICLPCKSKKEEFILPCVGACPYGALQHSW